ARNVTGVQTCALPISLRSPQQRRRRLCTKKRRAQIRIERSVPDLLGRGDHARRQKIRRAIHQNVEPPKMFARLIEQTLDFSHARSEERRVGKGCRWWW